jgi:transposase
MKLARSASIWPKMSSQVHRVNKEGAIIVRKALRRSQMLPFFAKLSPALSASGLRDIPSLGAGTAEPWPRVRLPPCYVKPYVKRGKNDAADAEAICEAVTRPTMRFVAIKSRELQAALSLHRARHLLTGQRTQLVNMMRSQLAEFGVTVPRHRLWHRFEVVN